ncbi:MAG TPA: hypothetical protein VD931_11555, partial [Baekduia sp.]|nr:hypothetical protein [Baekduia sp.]
MVEFDEQVAAQLEAVYQTRDVVRRRQLVFEALDPRPGDRVLDLGCGPGFYVAEALELVGLRRDSVALYPHEFSGGQRQR